MILTHALLSVSCLPCEIYHFSSVDSTNQRLKEWMPAVDTAIYADFQTAGRGQGDHIWHCRQKQGLLMSLLYYPKQDILADDLLKLSAVIVCECVNHHLQGCSELAKIKAPNDILIGDRKLAGLLLENQFQGNQLVSSIIGIGINLYQEQFDGTGYARTPVSLRQLGVELSAEDLFLEILRKFYPATLWDRQTIEKKYLANMIAVPY